MRQSREFALLKKDVSWWLNERPDVLIGYLKNLNASRSSNNTGLSPIGHRRVYSGDGTWAASSAYSSMRRLGLLAGVHMTVTERLSEEASRLRRVMY